MEKLIPICVLGGALGVPAFTAEVKMKVSDLPPAVQAAVKDQTKGATILGASKERENGRMQYEVETRMDNKGRDLTFAADGTLLEVEEEVQLASIPDAARKAIQKRAGTGSIRKVESVTQGSHVSYEAAVVRNGQEHGTFRERRRQCSFRACPMALPKSITASSCPALALHGIPSAMQPRQSAAATGSSMTATRTVWAVRCRLP